MKALIEKWLPIEEKEIRMAANILSETMEARKKWHSIFQVLVSIVNTESYIQRKYPLGMKGKSRHSQMKEN